MSQNARTGDGCSLCHLHRGQGLPAFMKPAGYSIKIVLEPKACFTTIGEPSSDSHSLLGLEGKAGREATSKHPRTEWLTLLTVTLKSLYQRDSEYPGFSSEHIVRGLSRFEPSPFSSTQPLSVLLHLCSQLCDEAVNHSVLPTSEFRMSEHPS